MLVVIQIRSILITGKLMMEIGLGLIKEQKQIMYLLRKKGKFNPLNREGQVSRCIICDSKMHWASRCPHNKRKEHFVYENHKSQDSDHEDSSCDEECEDVEIVLLTDEVDEFQIFVTESAKSAVVDTGVCRNLRPKI